MAFTQLVLCQCRVFICCKVIFLKKKKKKTCSLILQTLSESPLWAQTAKKTLRAKSVLALQGCVTGNGHIFG